MVSPGTTFRLTLYRWAYDDEAEAVVATQLGTATHSNGSDMFNTSGEGGSYARLFISVDTSVAGQTRVVGGVARDSVVRDKFFDSASYREVMYRDVSSARLTYGSYGLVSANCPARFMRPSFGPSPVKYQATDAQMGFQQGTYTITPISSTELVQCLDDMKEGRWKMSKSRMAIDTDSTTFGFKAVIPETTIDVYTASGGTTDWKPLETNIVVSGFGSSTNSGATTTIALYSLDEVSVQRCGSRSWRESATPLQT